MKPVHAVILLFILCLSGFNAEPSPDETASLLSSPSHIMSNFLKGQHPPLYFSLAWLIKRSGFGLLTLRIFSFCCSIVTVYLLSRILIMHGRKTAGLLLMLSPAFVHFSAEGTGYALHTLTGTLVFFTTLNAQRRGKFLPFVAACIVAAYSYYYHLFFIFGIFLSAFIDRDRRFLKPLAVLFFALLPLAAAAFFNPFTSGILTGSSSNLAITKPALFEMNPQNVLQFFLFTPAYLLASAPRYFNLPLIPAFLLSAAFWAFLGTKNARRIITLFIVPYIMLALFSLVTQSRILRYSFFPYHLLPYFCVLVTAAALSSRSPLSRKAHAFLISLTLFFSLLWSTDLYPGNNFNKISPLLSQIREAGYDPFRDMIFANHIYEWDTVTFSDQVSFIDKGFIPASSEDFSLSGASLFSGKEKIFELSMVYMDNFPFSGFAARGDPLYDYLLLTRKAQQLLRSSFRIASTFESGGYRLRVWESFD